jgi:hypothetical protein
VGTAPAEVAPAAAALDAIAERVAAALAAAPQRRAPSW